MKTNNGIIYHCVSCGHVVHADFDDDAPQCCGNPMAKAAASANREGHAPKAKAGGSPESEPPRTRGHKAPH